MKYLFSLATLFLLASCVSTKSTLKNVDSTAKRPSFANKMYLITEYAKDGKYAFDADYPINIGSISENQENLNVQYYFNGLEGPNGEKIIFNKVDTCCPFPSKNTAMGAGTISIYEITLEGSTKKLTMYFNIYEKGQILCPKGFQIKKQPVKE
ncbi:2-dehydro-3-deoxyphosphooctonate aldolase [Flavobacterium ardleyense]|uniref:2-dehydro-3-deoxyphosphooctonate aldolase n=1 Tax=Flavobacterium ardleyense TaxID=2038737 RepID=A0ABW5ZAG8_9FLAO